MISSQVDVSLKFKEHVKQHDKKKSAFKLLRSNFELLNKQMKLCDLLGDGLQLYNNDQDEFLASHIAIELMLEENFDRKSELFEHIDELISARFFEQYYSKDSNQHQVLTLELAQQFSDLLESVALKVSSEWSSGGMEQFFEVVDEYLPDGGCDYFRRRYADQFSSPMLAS